jgi:D-3-phosphoglycerate dehydrogenase
MAVKILISDKIEPICPERFRKAGFEVDQKADLPAGELESIIGGYHGLVVRSATKVTARVLAKGAAGELKIVGRAGAGVDNIDLAAAEANGIKVVNTPGLNANAVAELVVAFMIVLARKLGFAMGSIREGRWEKKGLSGTEVSGKTLGLVGIGAVGRLVAAKARGLGMEVLAHDPLLAASDVAAAGARPVGLEEIWSGSDFVSLHLPKNARTTNLVGAEVLGRMRPGAFLINCARGGLVDEAALHDALASGRLAGAAADVFAQEPPGASPLLALPNFVGTPHLGAATEEAQLGVAAKVAELLIEHLSGGPGR